MVDATDRSLNLIPSLFPRQAHFFSSTGQAERQQAMELGSTGSLGITGDAQRGDLRLRCRCVGCSSVTILSVGSVFL